MTATSRTIGPVLRIATGGGRRSMRRTRSADNGVADSRSIRVRACRVECAPQWKRNQVVASTSSPWPSMKSATQRTPSRRKIATSRRSLWRRSWPKRGPETPRSEKRLTCCLFRKRREGPALLLRLRFAMLECGFALHLAERDRVEAYGHPGPRSRFRSYRVSGTDEPLDETVRAQRELVVRMIDIGIGR